MSRPALLDKLMQAGGWLLKPGLVPIDDVTIKRNQTAVYVALDALIRQGGGLAVGQDKRIYVDFSLMPTDAFEDLLKSIRVPVWLTKNLTIYVNGTTGSDTLDEGRGVTAAKPFKSVSAALLYVSTTYNLYVYNVIIQVAAADYLETITLPDYTASSGSIQIYGADSENPQAVRLGTVRNSKSSTYYFYDLTIQATSDVSVGYGLYASQGQMYLYNVVVDISSTIATTGNLAALYTESSGSIFIPGSNLSRPIGLTIKVSSSVSPSNLLSSRGGLIRFSADITIIGDANITGAVASASSSGVISVINNLSTYPGRLPVVTANGAITGKRYIAALNGIISTGGGGSDYFPGSIAGGTITGGQYE